MNEFFRLRVTDRMVRGQYRLNLDILKVNQVSFEHKIFWTKNLEFSPISHKVL